MARHGHAVAEPVVSAIRGDSARASQGLMALLRERRRLSEPVRAPRDPFTPDALDAAKDLEEEQLWLAVSDRREEIQGQIEEAVRLLFEGQYGRCVDCRMAIPPARLRALPFAIRCLACQERLERTQLAPTRRDFAPGSGGTFYGRGGEL